MTPRQRIEMAVPLVALAFAGAISLWFSRHAAAEGAPDRASAAGTIFGYLCALERHDLRQLAGFAPGTHEGEEDIDGRLQRFGGASASQAEVEISSALSPSLLSVTIRTVGPDAQKLAWTENMIWCEGSWKLVLGSARELSGELSVASECQ